MIAQVVSGIRNADTVGMGPQQVLTRCLYQPKPEVYLTVYTHNDTVNYSAPLATSYKYTELHDIPTSYEIPI